MPKYRWDITKVASCMGQFLQVRFIGMFNRVCEPCYRSSLGASQANICIHLRLPPSSGDDVDDDEVKEANSRNMSSLPASCVSAEHGFPSFFCHCHICFFLKHY